MTKAFNARLTKLEGLGGLELSERARAWLGLRPPLTAEEEAAEPEPVAIDLSGCSPELREWLRCHDVDEFTPAFASSAQH